MGFSTKNIHQTQSGFNRQREINFGSTDFWWRTETLLFFSCLFIGLEHWGQLPASSGKRVISSVNAISSVLKVIEGLSSSFHVGKMPQNFTTPVFRILLSVSSLYS